MDVRSATLLAGSVGFLGLAVTAAILGISSALDAPWLGLQVTALAVGCTLLLGASRRGRGGRHRPLDWRHAVALGYLALAAALLAGLAQVVGLGWP